MLPGEFNQLSHWVDRWSLPTEKQRMMHRVESSMAELKPFYDELLPEMERIGDHFSTVPADAELSEADRNLFYMACSWIEVSRCFEAWNQNDVRHDFFDPQLIQTTG